MKKGRHLLVTLPIALLVATLLLLPFLPYLFNQAIAPRLLASLPWTEGELSLWTISPWGAQGSLRLANPDRPLLNVPRFRLAATPGSLLRGRISELVLDGAELHLQLGGGRPLLPGLAEASDQAGRAAPDAAPRLPLAFENITFNDCRLTLHLPSGPPATIRMDGGFALEFLRSSGDGWQLARLAGQLRLTESLRGSGQAELRHTDDGYAAKLELHLPDLATLHPFLPTTGDLQPTGSLLVKGEVQLTRALTAVTSYQASAELAGLQLQQYGRQLLAGAGEEPILAQLTGTPELGRFALKGRIMAGPEMTTLQLQGNLDRGLASFNGTGRLQFDRLKAGISLDYHGQHREAATGLHFQLASDAFHWADLLDCQPATMTGSVDLDGSVTRIAVAGQLPEITIKKSATSLSGLSFKLPIQLPWPEQEGEAGQLAIDRIRYRGKNAGSLRASLRPSAEGLGFASTLTSPLVPKLRLTCEGSAGMGGTLAVGCRLPETELSSTALTGLVDLPAGLSFSGRVGGSGEWQQQDHLTRGRLAIIYRDGILKSGSTELAGINVDLDFPHLPLVLSGPGQLATVGSMDLGKIRLTDGRIRFRIDEGPTLFLENSRFGWCGGKAETGSVRLTRDMKELETTLYCDRIGFSELLRQFGIDQAEGEGSLNGRLPIQVGPGGVVVDDGFLFSTPGNSGIVRFNNTRQLLQGMGDISASAYLDYSMKALENFTYNWTKLSFNSDKSDLLIAMQLDGKPADPLPFGYQSGQIVPSSKGPGLQHPIRLDVNFRLPLQELLQYGKNIQSLMENIKK